MRQGRIACGDACLCEQEKASEYVDAYWESIVAVLDDVDQNVIKGEIKGHLKDGGIVCFCVMGLNLSECHSPQTHRRTRTCVRARGRKSSHKHKNTHIFDTGAIKEAL